MMREYKRYEEYKDSGVEWIGTIPNEWDVERFRTLTKNIQNGKWGEEAQNNSDDIYCVRVADYNREKNIVKDQEFTIRNLDKSSREELLLEKDDLLLEKSGGGDKQPVGFVAQYKSEKPAIYANFMAKIEPRKEYIKTDYLKYVNISVYQKREISKVINQTTGIQNLDTKRYLEIESPLPSKREQQKITSFLDQKIAEIDEIISKKETLIDHLEKYKKSVITEAVTKGKLGNKYITEDGELVDEIEMKDSGVEWIGEIPEYWEISKLKHIKGKSKNALVDGPFGSDLKSKHFIKDGEVYVIESNFATTGELKEENLKTISKDHYQKVKRSEVFKDDIVIAKIGARYGRNSILPSLSKKAVISGNSMKLTIDKDIYYVKFMEYQLFALKRSGFMETLANQTAQPALSLGIMNNLKLTFTNKKNQKIILKILNKRIKSIDNLIQKTKQSIQKYKKYKKSLIFEAVTGKIDLRDYELKGGE